MVYYSTGPNPKPGKGTHIQCLLQSERRSTSPSEWTAVLKSRHKENGVLVSVTPPADCIVAEWRLTVENIVSNSTKPRALKFTLKESIFILFNPWCRGLWLVWIVKLNVISKPDHVQFVCTGT